MESGNEAHHVQVLFAYNALNRVIPVRKKKHLLFAGQPERQQNSIDQIQKYQLFTTLLTGLHFAFWESNDQNRLLMPPSKRPR